MTAKAGDDKGSPKSSHGTPPLPTSTTLRNRLSRDPSQGSLNDTIIPGKTKLKLHSLSTIASTTPVLLSPRGTPLVSPSVAAANGHFEFFPAGSVYKKDTDLGLLDNGHNGNDELRSPSLLDSPDGKIKFQTAAKLNRLPSYTKKSPVVQPKKRSSQSTAPNAINKLNTAVRPHSTILVNNFKSNAPQKYQQQEQTYLNSITNYKNRYKSNDDYYDNNVPYNTDDDNEVDEGEQTDSSTAKFDNELLDDLGYDLDQTTTTDIEAIKTLSQQIGLSNDELQLSTEYAIDTNSLLDLLNKNEDIQLRNTDDNANISERLEWQAMLQSVLTGDVVTGEKTRLVRRLNEDAENFFNSTFREDLWLEIRAKLFGRTLEEQRKLVLYYRGMKVDETLDDILNFKLEMPDDIKSLPYDQQVNFASERVNCILDRYDKCKELWTTRQEMINDKPICATPEFISRIDGLVAWTSVTEAIERESYVLKKWVGNDDLNILNSSASSQPDDNLNSAIIQQLDNDKGLIFTDYISFVERIMKEKDIESLFNKKLFATFNHWTIKAKNSHLQYHHYFEELGLPSYLENLFVLTSFPTKLMKELIKTRLAFANKLKNSTMMMIDQLLEDLKMYIRLAVEVRTSFLEYYSSNDEWVPFPDYQDADFDKTLLDCIHHYLLMLNKKLLYSPRGSKTFRTFKEAEELEREWDFLQNMGFYLEGAGIEIATQFTNLLNKLITRLNYYAHYHILGPPSGEYRIDKKQMIRWYTTGMENLGQLRRKFLRFYLRLKQHFENNISFNLIPSRVKKFFSSLKETNHLLFHSPKLAEDGIYIFVSEGLANRPHEVKAILQAKYLGVNFSKIPSRHLDAFPMYNYQEEIDDESHVYHKSEDYVIVLVPPKALMWDGQVIHSDMDSLPLNGLQRGKVRLLINNGGDTEIEMYFEHFRQCVGDTIGNVTNRGCSINSIERELLSISKGLYRVSCLSLESVPPIRNQFRGLGDCQDVVQNMFLFSRDLGRDTLRNTREQTRRGAIILKLINVAVEWLNFIVDDCPPSDPKTFRWCVTALEFAMDITRGFNILTLDSEKFYRLKDKVAGCMSLLISHFDIMGARARAFQKTSLMEVDTSRYQDMYQMDKESLEELKSHMMSEIKRMDNDRRQVQVDQKAVGRVLDNTDMENQLLTYLASSFSSVSIKWQKGKFIGGGTFGSVFASINLDTGGAMAVKEIKFADRQSIKTIVPAIKGEMSVLEMISHPNIIQFFGVEVHRDRVYIFMELCSGGSLAGLLEYGRIEDEAVIQLYALQMLEALAYLHQFGIIHSDVKPDNILLDHMGVIKFIDFGSAKVIPIHDTKMTEQSSGSSSVNTSTTTPISAGAGSSVNVLNFSSGSNSNGSDANLVIPTPQAINSTRSSISSLSHFEITNETHLELIERGGVVKPHALTGTPMYMSPETIKGDTNGKFGALDIWSLGCCVLEMATGRRPWSNLDNEFAVMYHIAAGHLPQFPSSNELSGQGLKFLSRCIDPDPNSRATAAELLMDPWIQAIRDEAFAETPAFAASSSSIDINNTS